MSGTVATQYILEKTLDNALMPRDEALYLLGVPLHSEACYLLMNAANRLSHQRSNSRGTIYSQVGINS